MSAHWFSVGEFSKITGLSVKTLRFYHEKGILIPSRVDESSGYRYYDRGKVERARIILWLRQMEFSIDDISAILRESDDELDLLTRLENQKRQIAERMQREREIVKALGHVIVREREARQLLQKSGFQVEEKHIGAFEEAAFWVRGPALAGLII